MQPVYGHQKQGLRLALTGTLLLAGVLGGGSMLGALTYSGASPVNLWLMIGLFCFLPLALTLSGALMSTRSAHTPFLAEFFARLLAKYIGAKSAAPKLPPLLVRVSGRAWLIWWLQLAGLVAQLAALVTFVMVLLFNDVAFGWASTIIEQSRWLHGFFAVFTAPWQWLLAPPSELLINASQYFRGTQTLDVRLLGGWWPHLALAMVAYGVMPKLLLMAWLHYKAKRALVFEVTQGGELGRFFHTVNLQTSQAPKMPPSLDDGPPLSQAVFTLPAGDNLVAWQRPFVGVAALGLKRWADDEQWLLTQAPTWGQNLYVLVQEEQTPTAELADTIALIRQFNTKVAITLLLQTGTVESASAPRHLNQQQSWRFFAAEQRLNLVCTQQLNIEGGVLVRGPSYGA